MSKNIFHIINKATKDHNLKHSDLRIFMCLISYNSYGKIFPSLETISKDTGIKSIPDISKGLRKLRELDYIESKQRKHQSNIYKIKYIECEMKTKKEKPKVDVDINSDVKYMDNAMIEVVAGQFAKATGRLKPESSDFAIVNKLLNLKLSDHYKKDCMNTVRKCLMLLYFINIHIDKLKGDNPYPYFQTVYSTANYNSIRKKIFETEVKQYVKFKTGINNSYN